MPTSAKSVSLFLLGIFALSLTPACATSKSVPDISSDRLPEVSFRALSPRTLTVKVDDTRKVNQDAGNSAQVENAVLTAISRSAARGGLKIDPKSRNHLAIQIADYSDSGAEGECVKLTGTLTAKWGTSIAAESYGCHVIKHLLIGIQLGGSISEAYTFALGALLRTLDSKQTVLLGLH